MPDGFIRLAEETGLILPLGAWVLAEACRQAAIWQAAFHASRMFAVSVNVSAHQFNDPVFLPTLTRIIESSGVDARHIKLELTETALVDNPERVEQVLRQARGFRVQTALDDFGTGYCSMSYLHRFPFDTLKIDQSFVRSLETKPRNCQIVASTIDLSHKLGMTVVAEGVETPQEAQTLIGLGCEYAQGRLFRMPLPVTEADRFLAGMDNGI
jgi:EAL domain-containing protein (putative c-di-GMP-specific phosphodiesterase class I)